jgi:hypothetical protein
MEIGTEAALFPENEYINGIFVAVYHWTTEADKYVIDCTHEAEFSGKIQVGEKIREQLFRNKNDTKTEDRRSLYYKYCTVFTYLELY